MNFARSINAIRAFRFIILHWAGKTWRMLVVDHFCSDGYGRWSLGCYRFYLNLWGVFLGTADARKEYCTQVLWILGFKCSCFQKPCHVHWICCGNPDEQLAKARKGTFQVYYIATKFNCVLIVHGGHLYRVNCCSKPRIWARKSNNSHYQVHVSFGCTWAMCHVYQLQTHPSCHAVQSAICRHQSFYPINFFMPYTDPFYALHWPLLCLIFLWFTHWSWIASILLEGLHHCFLTRVTQLEEDHCIRLTSK